jgi:hypothetical protein
MELDSAAKARLQAVIDRLPNDKQLHGNPSLRGKIKRLLEAQLKPVTKTVAVNPFAPNAQIKQYPEPEPETTETPIEKIRERNRYIKT